MVAFEKPAGRYEPTINKRTPLMGKAGPDKRKREVNQIEAFLDDQRLATHNQVRDLFPLVGNWSRIKIIIITQTPASCLHQAPCSAHAPYPNSMSIADKRMHIDEYPLHGFRRLIHVC